MSRAVRTGLSAATSLLFKERTMRILCRTFGMAPGKKKMGGRIVEYSSYDLGDFAKPSYCRICDFAIANCRLPSAGSVTCQNSNPGKNARISQDLLERMAAFQASAFPPAGSSYCRICDHAISNRVVFVSWTCPNTNPGKNARIS